MEAQGSCKLRAVRLNKVLQLQGCMLRKSAVDFFRHSEEVNDIDAFLSHSWKASSFAKHVALCVYYRWKPSLFAGLVAAVLGPLVCPMRLAPVVQVYIALAVVCGMTALLFTLLTWPTRQMVFLDKACIEQENPQAKTDGIMSLGYFLGNCAKTVVLWDESYVLSGFATALSQPTSRVVPAPRCGNSLATRVIATPRGLPPLPSPSPPL